MLICTVSRERLLHRSWAWLHRVQFTWWLDCHKSQWHEEEHLWKHWRSGVYQFCTYTL